MAFMAAPVSAAGNHEPRMPILGFNAKSGRLLLLDRVRDEDGEWETRRDTSNAVQKLKFLVDFGRLEVGWIYFSANRAPLFALAPYGQPGPAMPPSPGTSSKGRPLNFKAGFRLPVVSNAIGGVREFAGNSMALINGMNELHTAFDGAPEARVGQIPAVELAEIIEIESGQSNSFQPVFMIIGWAERPACLGPRTVPAPGTASAPRHLVRPPPPETEEEWARAAARAPIEHIAANGTVTGWGSEFDQRRIAVDSRSRRWADDTIPF